ncbi:MAG TPA: hypothetical protein PL085_11670 [Agriterribacter sp.]|nr:hypothetical protein [Agriterribacter sp.]HRQ17727.1 hypothetical protein [Agriterribacter sp.]
MFTPDDLLYHQMQHYLRRIAEETKPEILRWLVKEFNRISKTNL